MHGNAVFVVLTSVCFKYFKWAIGRNGHSVSCSKSPIYCLCAHHHQANKNGEKYKSGASGVWSYCLSSKQCR